MSKVSLKILDRGLTYEYTLTPLSWAEEHCMGEEDILTTQLKEINNPTIEKLIKKELSKISEDITTDEICIGRDGTGVYFVLLNEETSTKLVLEVTPKDHDGNELRLDHLNTKTDLTAEQSLYTDNLIKEVIGLLTDYNTETNTHGDVEINEDTVTFEETRNLWSDIEEPEEPEEPIMISNILKDYTNKTVHIAIDDYQAVFCIEEIQEFNAEDIMCEFHIYEEEFEADFEED